jgi:hypothetical protein
VLIIIDTFSCFSWAVAACFIHRGENVIVMLDRICTNGGYPKTIWA